MRDMELIGRDKELKALYDLLSEFLSRGPQGQALWLNVHGEEGVGRSALLDELVIESHALGEVYVLRADVFPVADYPFGAVSSALALDLDIPFWESEYAKKEKIESRLAAFARLKLPQEVFDSAVILPVFGRLLGVDYPLELHTPANRRGKGKLVVFNAVRRYLQALRASLTRSENPPLLVLWFDDLERMDSLSLELLVHLVQKKDCLWPLVILSSSRAPFSSRLDYLEEFREFSLGPLSKLSRRRLVQRLEEQGAGGGSGQSVSAQLRDLLIEGAPGNPLLISETWRLLREKVTSPESRERRRRLVAALDNRSRALAALELPGILRERHRRLNNHARNILQAVAILGTACSQDILSRLLARLNIQVRDLEADLAALAGQGFLLEGGAGGGGTVRLACPLYYEILVESLTPERSAELRQQCADLLYQMMEEENHDFVFLVGAFLRQSYFLKEDWAVSTLSLCGDRLLLLEDYRAAEASFQEAMARLGLEGTLEGSEMAGDSLEQFDWLLVRSGRARLGDGRIKEAFATLSAALMLSRGHAFMRPRVEACLDLAEIMVLRGDWAGAERFHAEALEVARAYGEQALTARCLTAAAQLKLKREEIQAAGTLLGEALALDEDSTPGERRLDILLNLAVVRQQSGEIEAAQKLYRDCLELADKLRDDTAAVTALSNLGRMRYEAGRVDEALEQFHRALSRLRASGDLVQTGNWLGYIGSVYYAVEEYETAIEYYSQALSIAQRTGNLRNQGIWLANLGNASYEMKEVSRALDYYLRALELARDEQDYSYVCTLMSTIGVYYYNLRQYEPARSYFSESLAVALEAGNLPVAVQNILYRGAILAHQGDPAAGLRALDEGEAIAREHGMAEHLAVAELFRGHIALLGGERTEARRHCRKAAELAVSTGNRKLSAEIDRALAACRSEEEEK